MSKILAVIPARKGSVGVPGKNTKEIAGKPLVRWTIDAAVKCDLIDNIVISTDIEEIFGWELDSKVEVVTRPAEQATNTAQLEDIMLSIARRCSIKYDDIILIQPTSPLLLAEDLTGGITKYNNEPYYTSLLSASKSKSFLWDKCFPWEDKNKYLLPKNYNPGQRPRRQELNGYYVENGAFYITSIRNLFADKCRIGGWKIGVYEMPLSRSLELDEADDFKIIEALLEKQNGSTT